MSSDGLFDALYARGAVAAEVDGRAWLAAMLDVEKALAKACAAEGLIDAASASTSPRSRPPPQSPRRR
jgi:adenylosuccinate lyase